MDLIDRSKAQDAVESKEDIMGYMDGVKDGDINRTMRSAIRLIERVPSAFEGMTNGDVLKAIFPDCIDYHGIIEVKTHLDMGKTFRRSWWDSPYKGQDGLI